MLLLFCGGLALTVAQSFGFLAPLPSALEAAGPDRLGGWRRLAEPELLAAFGHTIWVAGASAVLAVAGGALVAVAAWRLPALLSRVALVYKVPLVLPHIAVAFVVLVLFAGSGVLASAGHALGLVDAPADFPNVLYSGHGFGVILAYAYKGTGFAALLASAALARFDRRQIEAAAMLGASRLLILRRVVLPRLAPSLSAAFLILFCYGFGAFDIPFLLAESTPGMVPITAFDLYFRRDLANRPAACALLTAMFLFSLAFIAVYLRLARRLGRGERKL